MKAIRLIVILAITAIAAQPAETRRTVAECQTLLADNSTGDISPQDLRDCVIASAMLIPVNAQTGTTYAMLASDRGKHVTFSNGSPVAVSLSQATTTGFADGFWFIARNAGAGAVTITPTTSTINGQATLVLAQYNWAIIVSDGANYTSFRGNGFFAVAGPSQPRVYTFPDAAATMTYAGGTAKVGASGATLAAVEKGTCTTSGTVTSFTCDDAALSAPIIAASLATTDSISITGITATVPCSVGAIVAGTSFTIVCSSALSGGEVFNVLIVR